jgi:ArsR family transcriptional regulator
MWDHGLVTTLLPDVETADVSCCTPAEGLLDAQQARDVAKLFKALGDPARVRLLSIVASAPGGEACVCDLTEPVGLSQPTVSHHMKLLVEAGLVTRDQRGKWAYYAAAPRSAERLASAVSSVLG